MQKKHLCAFVFRFSFFVLLFEAFRNLYFFPFIFSIFLCFSVAVNFLGNICRNKLYRGNFLCFGFFFLVVLWGGFGVWGWGGGGFLGGFGFGGGGGVFLVVGGLVGLCVCFLLDFVVLLPF